MEQKNIVIWVLSFALIGALVEVPGFFLNQVLGGMLICAVITFVICCLVSSHKNKKLKQTQQF